jgi:hypothetical protein
MTSLDATLQTYLAELGIEPARPVRHRETIDRREAGPWLLRAGSTAITLSTFEDDAGTWCRIAAMVAREVSPSLVLLHRLLRLNAEVRLGAFLLFEDRTLAFACTLPGAGLSFDAFSSALRYVASVGDGLDDEVIAICGGYRAADLLDGDAPC